MEVFGDLHIISLLCLALGGGGGQGTITVEVVKNNFSVNFSHEQISE